MFRLLSSRDPEDSPASAWNGTLCVKGVESRIQKRYSESTPEQAAEGLVRFSMDLDSKGADGSAEYGPATYSVASPLERGNQVAVYQRLEMGTGSGALSIHDMQSPPQRNEHMTSQGRLWSRKGFSQQFPSRHESIMHVASQRSNTL